MKLIKVNDPKQKLRDSINFRKIDFRTILNQVKQEIHYS